MKTIVIPNKINFQSKINKYIEFYIGFETILYFKKQDFNRQINKLFLFT